jgi:hypothetical protein
MLWCYQGCGDCASVQKVFPMRHVMLPQHVDQWCCVQLSFYHAYPVGNCSLCCATPMAWSCLTGQGGEVGSNTEHMVAGV